LKVCLRLIASLITASATRLRCLAILPKRLPSVMAFQSPVGPTYNEKIILSFAKILKFVAFFTFNLHNALNSSVTRKRFLECCEQCFTQF
jgi:hypothetical protein